SYSISSLAYPIYIRTSTTTTLLPYTTLFRSLKKRVIGAMIFAVPLFVIGMFFMDMPYGNYIMWALSTPILAYFGRQFFVGAWKRSEEHTSELQSRENLVSRLLLENKKIIINN